MGKIRKRTCCLPVLAGFLLVGAINYGHTIWKAADLIVQQSTVNPRPDLPFVVEKTHNSRSKRASYHEKSLSRPIHPSKTASKKKYLLIHLGPPKTATTSIQTDLTKINETLLQDNYFYVGRYYEPSYDPITKKYTTGRSETNLVVTLCKFFNRNLKAWPEVDQKIPRSVRLKSLADELRKYKGSNVLISDESLAHRFLKDPEGSNMLQTEFGNDWEIIILAGYRRYFQWLPSDMFQQSRMDLDGDTKGRKNNWPGQRGEGAGYKKGRRTKTLFPEYFENNWFRDTPIHRPTDAVLDGLSDIFPIRILNLHRGERSVQTRFVCELLPDAPKSCRAMRELEDSQNSSVLNKHSDSTTQHIHYDIISTEAANLGMVDTSRYRRKFVRDTLWNYTEFEIGKTPWDFDLDCPTPLQLQAFLNISLELEVKVLGEEAAAQMEAETRAAFEADVDKKVFCTVNAEATLQKEPWVSFFSQFAPVNKTTGNATKLGLQAERNQGGEVKRRDLMNDDGKKPFLIVHVGPIKTATTSIQTDLTRINETLSRDNYFYAGRYYNPVFNEKTNKEVLNQSLSPVIDKFLRLFVAGPQSKRGIFNRTSSVEAFKEELANYKGRNIVISDETITKKGIRDPEAFAVLADAFGDEWNIHIVANYRRFFQWLPSTIYQEFRLDMLAHQEYKIEWPALNASKGRRVKKLFPDLFTKFHRFTHDLVWAVNDTLPVKIFNLHEGEGSVTKRFVCELLPNAPKSCRAMQSLDQGEGAAVVNSAATNTALHLNYDIFTTQVADLGLIDMHRFRRPEIREALRNLTEVELGKTPWDFDLDCPQNQQLEEFLNASLVLEEKVLGREAAAKAEVETRAVFQESIDKKRFCTVNAKTSVQKEPWKSFFAKYAPEA